MPELDQLGAVGHFDRQATELNVEVLLKIQCFFIFIKTVFFQIGVGRHDSRLEHVHYDHAVLGAQFLHLSKGDQHHQ